MLLNEQVADKGGSRLIASCEIFEASRWLAIAGSEQTHASGKRAGRKKPRAEGSGCHICRGEGRLHSECCDYAAGPSSMGSGGAFLFQSMGGMVAGLVSLCSPPGQLAGRSCQG